MCSGLVWLIKPNNGKTILLSSWFAAMLTLAILLSLARYWMSTQFQEFAWGDAGGWTLQWRGHAVHQRAGAAKRGKQYSSSFRPRSHHFQYFQCTWNSTFYFHTYSPSLVCFVHKIILVQRCGKNFCYTFINTADYFGADSTSILLLFCVIAAFLRSKPI